MKLCAVYKSPKKADTYLYIEKRDDFSGVPEALIQTFGTPQYLTVIPLLKYEHIANISRSSFIDKIKKDGFYLQLPPKEKSLLALHRESLGLNSADKA